jgi:glycosyltransferase involved in cell wall biosynthesis
MRIVFAIPTWNRCEQLEITVRLIAKQIASSNINGLIVISDNCSDDSTAITLEHLKEEFNFIQSRKPTEHISGMFNYHEVLKFALEFCHSGDYIWSFGDDDDLNENALLKVFEFLQQSKPFFASAGNTKLPQHTNNIYQASMIDMTQKFSFFLTAGFISQCIFSYELVSEIVDKSLIIDKFSYDAYSHGTSTLWLGHNKKCIYMDLPISTFREYKDQTQDTRIRWEGEGVFMNIARFVDSVKFLIDEGILPKKIDKTFFRYWTFHFWDFLLYEATVMTLLNPASINSEIWNKLFDLCGLVNDAELAKRLEININLQRIALSNGIDKELIMKLTRKYTFWGGAVYDRALITPDILRSFQQKN